MTAVRLCAFACAAGLALTLASVSAADSPPPGATETVTCHFDVVRGLTGCEHSTVTVSAGACADVGYRLYSRDELDSVRHYRGNVIRSGREGITVSGGYAVVVRPHVRPLTDSGPHAFNESFTVEDATCTG